MHYAGLEPHDTGVDVVPSGPAEDASPRRQPMIGRLSGIIAASRPDEVIVDVSGVGYRVHIPLSTFYKLVNAPGVVTLHVHTHVREDAIQLFGFWTDEERIAFQRLIAVSGIGPKIALAVLSGIGVADLEQAVSDGDRGVLERIPGIGRKTAERVILELSSRPTTRPGRSAAASSAAKTAALGAGGAGSDADAVSALVHLGYSDNAAYDAIVAARRTLGVEAPIEGLLRTALRSLVR
jgi:Holliday junction DNA helicase RuvA